MYTFDLYVPIYITNQAIRVARFLLFSKKKQSSDPEFDLEL